MTAVVISQPMYFPWVGLFEQIRLADIYVHYGDVQFTRGFYNRVQIKTPQGSRWMTLPLKKHHQGGLIDEVLVDDRVDWRQQHRNMLKMAYRTAPYVDDMLHVVDRVFNQKNHTLADVSVASVVAVAEYFGLMEGRQFLDSRRLQIEGVSSKRLLDIVCALGCDRYITGLGARKYLDYQLFEDAGIRVEYMNYEKMPYSQLHGEFTPFVSTLDLIANMGKEGVGCIRSDSVYWKDYISHE